MSDDREAFHQTCNDYLRQYHSATVPASQPEQTDRGGNGVKVGQPEGAVATHNNNSPHRLEAVWDFHWPFLAEPQWTTTPPTEPGWYWAWDGVEVWPILLHEWRGRLFHQITTDIEESVEKTGTHWLGPLSVPPPPEVTKRDHTL